MFAAFLQLLGALIIVFAPIDDFGHRRVRIGRDLHQIKAGFPGGTQRLGAGYNSQLSAILANNSKTIRADGLVYPRIFGDVSCSSRLR